MAALLGDQIGPQSILGSLPFLVPRLNRKGLERGTPATGEACIASSSRCRQLAASALMCLSTLLGRGTVPVPSKCAQWRRPEVPGRPFPVSPLRPLVPFAARFSLRTSSGETGPLTSRSVSTDAATGSTAATHVALRRDVGFRARRRHCPAVKCVAIGCIGNAMSGFYFHTYVIPRVSIFGYSQSSFLIRISINIFVGVNKFGRAW